jgi:hypothetical protein
MAHKPVVDDVTMPVAAVRNRELPAADEKTSFFTTDRPASVRPRVMSFFSP